MERNKNQDSVRERMYPSMLPLYDSAIEEYKKYCKEPEFEAQTDKSGRITKISFMSIPTKIMSGIYHSTMRLKEKIDCRFILEYTLLKCDDRLRSRFEIRK